MTRPLLSRANVCLMKANDPCVRISDLPENVEVVIYPSAIDIPAMQGGSPSLLPGGQTFTVPSLAGATNAQTGQIQLIALFNRGVRKFILGHSESRLAGETDKMINTKLKEAIKLAKEKGEKLSVTLCIGEDLDKRSDGTYLAVIEDQIKAALEDISAADLEYINLKIAYEPIWAIGRKPDMSPRDPATIPQVKEAHAFIRNKISELLNSEIAARIKLLYGGSVKPGNAREILSLDDVDGALIGGASLKFADFSAIVDTAISPSQTDSPQ